MLGRSALLRLSGISPTCFVRAARSAASAGAPEQPRWANAAAPRTVDISAVGVRAACRGAPGQGITRAWVYPGGAGGGVRGMASASENKEILEQNLEVLTSGSRQDLECLQ